MSDIEFIDGLHAFAPHDKAPDFVKCVLSIDREKLIEWLHGKTGEKIKADVKVAKSGKYYIAVNTWKPRVEQEEAASVPPADFADDDIPF